VKKLRKKIIAIVIGVVGLLAVFFFFFAPGWVFGGINYINPDSQVRIIERVFTRVPIQGTTTTGFEQTQIIEHDLTPYQVAELSRLLRRSWFGRTIRQGTVAITLPDYVQSFNDFSTLINDGVHHQISLDSTWGRWMWRGGSYNNRLRIHNPNWDYGILRILEVNTYEK